MKKSEVIPLALCGAKSKRTGKPCRQPAMRNGRCRLHGGKSTGPRTKKGIDAIQRKHFIHGKYTQSNLIEFECAYLLLRKAKSRLQEIVRLGF